MSDDDDQDCPGHVWRFVGFTADEGGATSEYSCEECGGLLLVAPGDVMPETG